MSRPKANVFLSNGNLGGQAPGQFGVSGVVVTAPVAPTAGYLVPFLLKSKKQAQAAFAAAGNEAVLKAIVEGFFAEAADGTSLFVIVAPQATSLTGCMAHLETLLNFGNGKIRLVGLAKFPAEAYAPVIDGGFDEDVHDAVTATQTKAATWLANRKPFRALIQGYGYTNAAAAQDYSADTKRNVGIVIGAIDDNTAQATFLALGRASKEQPQRNIGRVKSDSLVIAEDAVIKLGAVALENIDGVDLDTIHEKRYITFERNESAPGYIFNDDNMLTSLEDDFNSLRNGRVIDSAVRIAYEAYYEELKDDVDVDENGRLSIAVEKALETKIETAIDGELRAQLSKNSDGTSAVQCLVNPDPTEYATLYTQNDIEDPNFDILATNKVYIFVSIRPKGCLKYIDIYLGFSSAS